MGARKLTRRKTPLLTGAEYVSPDPDNSNQVSIARLELIHAVRRTHRKFLEALSEDVFPFYSKLARAGYDFDQILCSPRVSPFEALTEDGGLKRALSEWAKQFNANCAWLMDDTLQALRGWYVAPEHRESLRWNVFHSNVASGATGEAFEFHYERWETELRSWSHYNDSVRKSFEQKLSEYEEETRKRAELCGLVRAQRKHSPENFDWFVLYQFEGLTYREIAARRLSPKIYRADPDSTVRKGIKTVAKLVGWGQLRTRKSKRNRKIR
jgi:hypothetical protein